VLMAAIAAGGTAEWINSCPSLEIPFAFVSIPENKENLIRAAQIGIS